MKALLITTIALCTLVLAGPVMAVQMFDFSAQAIVPSMVGDNAEVYGIIQDGVETPLPLDFANYQYTIVITGLTLDFIGATSEFSGGMIAIYRDDATPADYANAATFMDGTPILSGMVTTLMHTMFFPTVGSASGMVNWTGGTRLNEIAPEDQVDWPILTSISRSSFYVEPGYTEMWDGKVEPSTDIVDTEDKSLSGVKAQYR
jgi:hypothetical protein